MLGFPQIEVSVSRSSRFITHPVPSSLVTPLNHSLITFTGIARRYLRYFTLLLRLITSYLLSLQMFTGCEAIEKYYEHRAITAANPANLGHLK